jgi:hypothetical protein
LKYDTLDGTMQPGKIGLYIHEVLYNRGGTEAYTVRMAAALAEIYPAASISFVSECYSPSDLKNSADFCALMEERYGVRFDPGRVGMRAVQIRGGPSAADPIPGRLAKLLHRMRIQDASREFDLFFYCSRGNFGSKAKRSVAIIHFPPVPCKRFFRGMQDRFFARSYDAYLPNSTFTQGYLEQYWPGIPHDKIRLLYPPIAPVPDLGLPRRSSSSCAAGSTRPRNWSC